MQIHQTSALPPGGRLGGPDVKALMCQSSLGLRIPVSPICATSNQPTTPYHDLGERSSQTLEEVLNTHVLGFLYLQSEGRGIPHHYVAIMTVLTYLPQVLISRLYRTDLK